MGIFKKAIFIIVVVFLSASFSSCSKNNFSHNYKAKSKGTSASIDPISRKSEPVRSKYIVPSKKKRILGQDKPKI